MDALIGGSGFVGATLQRQRAFDQIYRSTDIGEIDGRTFETVICAGAPAQKWIADRDPDADIANLKGLAAHLATLKAETFILISTVDVFADSQGRDESSAPDEVALGAYGRNRLWLERFVQAQFAQTLVVRLPGLVGPGLRKNVIYDFLNANNLAQIESRGVFQFYPMVNLWADLRTALSAGLDLIHLTAEPISVADVSAEGFGRAFDNRIPGREPARYELQTRHAALFGGQGRHTYSRRDSLMAVRAYAQSEPASKPSV